MATSSFDTTNSYPISMQTPQSDWALQLSQVLAALGQQQLNWAQGVFGQTSQITDQMINNYMANSQAGMGLAANNIQRYENLFQPQENALIQDANTYASTPRIQENMGAAESATGQAMDQGRINAENTLRSYGIDPSSGRYQELEAAQRAGAAAAQAGAGQQSELATEATGRELRNQAIAVGQQYPGQAVNALNSSLQGIAGAENAALGNANTGANLMHVADPYFSSAMNLKYPPTGQISSGVRSSSSDNPSGSSSSRNSNSGAGGNPNGGGGGGGGGPYDNNAPGYINPGGTPNYGATNIRGGGGGSIAQIVNVGGNNTPNDFSGYQADPNSINGDPWSTDQFASSGAPGQFYDPYSAFSQDSQAPTDPNSQFFDPYSAGSSGNPYGQFGDQSAGYQDYTNGNFDQTQTPDQSFSDQSFQDMQPAPSGDMSSVDTSGGGDYSNSWGDYSDSAGFARGGGVLPGPGATTGGHVPVQASPSMGRNTDDIPARLNAEEFVIPRDVARWKGQEFFQKLIEESRRKRLGAPAKGKAKPALGGQPRFVSQHMGAQ